MPASTVHGRTLRWRQLLGDISSPPILSIVAYCDLNLPNNRVLDACQMRPMQGVSHKPIHYVDIIPELCLLCFRPLLSLDATNRPCKLSITKMAEAPIVQSIRVKDRMGPRLASTYASDGHERPGELCGLMGLWRFEPYHPEVQVPCCGRNIGQIPTSQADEQ